MILNKTITQYSDYPEEQAAFKAMQEASFDIAELLMHNPNKMAPDIQGSAYFVAKLDNELHIFSSPATLNEQVDVKNCMLFIVSGYEGQSEADLLDTTKHMQEWIENPAYADADQEVLNNLVNYHFGRSIPAPK